MTHADCGRAFQCYLLHCSFLKQSASAASVKMFRYLQYWPCIAFVLDQHQTMQHSRTQTSLESFRRRAASVEPLKKKSWSCFWGLYLALLLSHPNGSPTPACALVTLETVAASLFWLDTVLSIWPLVRVNHQAWQCQRLSCWQHTGVVAGKPCIFIATCVCGGGQGGGGCL